MLEAELNSTRERNPSLSSTCQSKDTFINQLELSDKENTRSRPPSHLSSTSPLNANAGASITPAPRAEPSSEPILASDNVEVATLKKRHNAARLIIEELTNKNVSLNHELVACRQDLESAVTKLSLVCDNLKEEKNLHSALMEKRNQDIENLHSRVNELLSDRENQINSYNSVLAEISQQKEFIERLKKEHTYQLETLDKVCLVSFAIEPYGAP